MPIKRFSYAGRLLDHAVSLITPAVCAACGNPEFSGSALCGECARRLPFLSDPRCSRCGAPTPVASTDCGQCQGLRSRHDVAWTCCAYGGVARSLVGELKSRGSRRAAMFMASQMAERLPAELRLGILVPVPDSPSRRRKYGFNQAQVLSLALARQIGAAHQNILRRDVCGPRQVGLQRSQRMLNAARGVRVISGLDPPPVVILVDDVITTGATLAACAQALHRAGVREVNCLAFARTLR